MPLRVAYALMRAVSRLFSTCLLERCGSCVGMSADAARTSAYATAEQDR